MSDLAPGTRVGAYVVQTPLGQGGVAQVYRVQHSLLETAHALKVLHTPGGTARKRLLEEGRIQAKLRHPHVVPVTDVLDVNGAPGLLMDLVEGPTLAALLTAGPLPLDQIEVLGAGILAGVAAAHQHGLVHRDLKPGNVLVSIEHGVLVPRVTDFGLARVLDADDHHTRSGASLGTPRYMAPEQIRDPRDVDARSDVWALGAVLYELCCGHPAFDAVDQLELYRAIDEGHYVPVRQRRPDLPHHLVATVEAALRPRSDRPADAGALLDLWGPFPDPVPADPALAELLASLTPTWADAATSAATEPTWQPASQEQPPPLPAVPAPRSWAPLAYLGGSGMVLLAALLVVFRPQPVPTPSPVPALPTPPPPSEPIAPRGVEDELAVHAVRIEAKALEMLLDTRFDEAAKRASDVGATSATEAPRHLMAAGYWAIGEEYSALEELGRGRSWKDPTRSSGQALFALVRPGREPLPDGLESRVFQLLAADDPRADELVAELVRDHPSRRLPWYLASVVARRAGRPHDAAAALASGEGKGPETAMWRLERALVHDALGEVDAAAALFDALAEDRYVPPRARVARLAFDTRHARAAALATDLERLQRSTMMIQSRAHLAVADVYLARGETGPALEALGQAVAATDRSTDDLVLVNRMEATGELVRLAAHMGHDDRLVNALGELQAMRDRIVGWAAPELGRHIAVADALLADLRGDPKPKERLRADLTAEGAPRHHVEALGDGRPRIRVALLP